MNTATPSLPIGTDASTMNERAASTSAPTSAPTSASAAASNGPKAADLLPATTLVEWLRAMLLIREFENRCGQAYQQAKIGGFCHLYTGQEAAAIGTIRALNHDDPVITAYRDHGHALARGMDPGACMAEMFGKATGCAKGKGGSMHMFDRPNWLFGGHGIVGAQTPVGVGLAFAARYEWEVLGCSVNHPNGRPANLSDKIPAKKKVSLAYLGDGALNQGALHEAMNLAGLWDIPCIFVVENNGYSMGTSIARGTTMAHDLRAKGAAYGIRSEIIEGFDVVNLYNHFKPLVDWCRENQKPAFVDLKTYRYLGHSMSDPQKYRTKEEVEEFKSKDSIDSFASYLLTQRRGEDGKPALNEGRFMELQADVRDVVKHAMEFAESSPIPDAAAELHSDVLLNPMRNMSPSCDYVHGVKNPLL